MSEPVTWRDLEAELRRAAEAHARERDDLRGKLHAALATIETLSARAEKAERLVATVRPALRGAACAAATALSEVRRLLDNSARAVSKGSRAYDAPLIEAEAGGAIDAALARLAECGVKAEGT